MPEGKYLLNKVKVKADSKEVNTDDLSDYVKQTPNNFFLGMGRFRLGFYNISGNDSTKRINNWLRRVGEPPVIFDEYTTSLSKQQLEKVMFNNGYMNSRVTVDVELTDKKKANVTYNVESNTPYTVRNYIITMPNDTVMDILNHRKGEKIINKKSLFNVDLLDDERANIANVLRNKGYYNFRKELLFYAVDTATGKHSVDIELALQPHILNNDSAIDFIFDRKIVSQIKIYAFKDKRLSSSIKNRSLEVYEQDNIFIYTESDYKTFRPKALLQKIAIKVGKYYNERKLDLTYSLLNSMDAVKYVNITFTELEDGSLCAVIYVSQNRPHSISGELEFTYSGGNLGINAGAGYQNNNIFRGSETFSIGLNGGYETLGKFESNQYFSEIGGDIALKFPTLLLPVSKNSPIRMKNGSSTVGFSFNHQKRPEYERDIANASFKYSWKHKRVNFNYNLLDVSVIRLPWKSENFEDKYLNPSSSIRFSYEDHFIMRMGFGINTTNKKGISNNYYTVRANVVTAGNLLYGLSHLFKRPKNENGGFDIFNIQYSQYVKADVDYSYNAYITPNSRLVFHGALGVGVPYGNAPVLPFEERYYSGGANSVRGWGIRTLGPGTYKNSSGDIDFMKQSGDIKFDVNIEGRFKMFWKIEGALFIDAGNIWTIRDYKEQPGGYFQFDKFYQQIGLSYGAGIRLNFSYFILRLDMGIKLYDPSYEKKKYRWRTSITWHDDVAIHFAVGYPF